MESPAGYRRLSQEIMRSPPATSSQARFSGNLQISGDWRPKIRRSAQTADLHVVARRRWCRPRHDRQSPRRALLRRQRRLGGGANEGRAIWSLRTVADMAAMAVVHAGGGAHAIAVVADLLVTNPLRSPRQSGEQGEHRENDPPSAHGIETSATIGRVQAGFEPSDFDGRNLEIVPNCTCDETSQGRVEIVRMRFSYEFGRMPNRSSPPPNGNSFWCTGPAWT